MAYLEELLPEFRKGAKIRCDHCMEDGKSGIWFIHCRRLTKQEIEELF